MGAFFAIAAKWLVAEFANVFPNLVGVFGSVVSSFAKEEAAALHKAMTFFVSQVESTGSWETAFTATLNEIGTAEYSVLSDTAKHLLQAFMAKSKA